MTLTKRLDELEALEKAATNPRKQPTDLQIYRMFMAGDSVKIIALGHSSYVMCVPDVEAAIRRVIKRREKAK